MKRSVFMLVIGVLVQWVGGSVMAQGPVSGQPYQVPSGYEGFGPGTLINYGGYNYSIAGDGTMLLAAQSNQSASQQPANAQGPVSGQPYQVPAGYEGLGSGSMISYGGYNYSIAGDGTMLLAAQGNQSASQQPQNELNYLFGQKSNGQETNIGWQGGYQGPNSWNTGMNSYTGGPNGGQTMNGGFSRGPNGYTSTFGVGQVNPAGQTTNRSGTMTYQDPSNWATNYNYAGPDGRSYGGNVNQQNGITTAGFQGSAPGALPGTRVNGHGDVTFRGSDTFARGGGNVTDATGNVRLGGGNGRADRRGINGVTDAGLGNVRGIQTDDVRLRGANSTYTRNTQGNIPGVGSAHQNIEVNRRGAAVNVGVKVGGANVGVKGSVSAPSWRGW